MPQTNDIIRTRFCIENWGRFHQLNFWWRLLNWSPQQEVEEFLFANALQWLAAIDAWIDDTYVIVSARATNLTTPEPDTILPFYVTGTPKPNPVRVVSATVWVSRHGIDTLSNAKTSRFPINNLVVPQDRGRIGGDGQLPTLLATLTEEHFLISPLAPVWIGGFISSTDTQFVQTERAFINPVIYSLSKRSPKTSTRLVPDP